jgi:hypothetical protein
VSVIRARWLLRRTRRRLALAVIVVTATSLVALHHGVPMDTREMPAAAMCLAVLGAGAAVTKAVGSPYAPRVAPAVDWLLPFIWLTEPRSVPARASPLYLRLSVLRR